MSDREYLYSMTIDLQILNHLGINLYSNVAAVLSEAVANAWDADATEVRIHLENDAISIWDNGVGMTRADINDKYLKVGYDKRGTEGENTAKGRRIMGRKGIGKLSLFSIADHIELHTFRDEEENSLQLTTEGIQEAIKARENYYPKTIHPAENQSKEGTRIILRDLKKNRTSRTADALRKRIARRFSIIGLTVDIAGKNIRGSFDVFINDEKITRHDRCVFSWWGFYGIQRSFWKSKAFSSLCFVVSII